MGLLNCVTWIGDLVAMATGIAMLKDTFLDRSAANRLLATLTAAWAQLRHGPGRPDMAELRPALRFGIRIGMLVVIVASAGVCLVFPTTGDWHGMLLRTALALHMAAQVPCPWIRWITVGDHRAKLNDPPGVERRVQR